MAPNKKSLGIGLFALTIAGLLFGHRPLLSALVRPQETRKLAVGDKVPDFTVKDAAGKSWTLSDLQKRTESGVVSLTFWCTFCHSCRMMDAAFQKRAGDLKDKAAVVAIDASAADTAKRVEDFARDKKFTVPVFLDADAKTADFFGIRVTTTTVVIDKAGVLRYTGQFAAAESALKAVLEGKEVAVKETSPSG
ncbi:MAG: peroxiredoxin family protein [Planctomycetota bacterium]|nr:MAG: peroxiredoxin family protein [Planctomycetota bacterium]